MNIEYINIHLDMQQTGPTLIDESTMDIPIPCRVIGTINMVSNKTHL